MNEQPFLDGAAVARLQRLGGAELLAASVCRVLDA
jgi:hypothetical protein